MRQSTTKFVISSFLMLGTLACAPQLGDSCSASTDCSVNGDRFCDLSQPGGYCTIANCEPDSCGDQGVCIRFKPDEPRLSSDWCMAKCSKTSDCGRDEYVCRSTSQLNEDPPGGRRLADVLEGRKSAKFCVAKE